LQQVRAERVSELHFLAKCAISLNSGRMVKRAGLNARFHDLRHTYATLMLAAGVHAKIVSEALGHSTVAITLDIYSHVTPGLQEAAAKQLDSLLPVGVVERHEERFLSSGGEVQI